MQKTNFKPEHLVIIREEISILSMLDHTNIITYVESYEDQRYMYIVMEYFKQCKELKEIVESRIDNMNDEGNKGKPIVPEEEIQ